jgi:hypothetical protein
MKQHILENVEDYLLVNQLEISSIRITGGRRFVVGLSNKYDRKLMYVLFFYYWPNNELPDFSYKTLHGGSPLSVLEINKLRANVQNVLNSVLSIRK